MKRYRNPNVPTPTPTPGDNKGEGMVKPPRYVGKPVPVPSPTPKPKPKPKPKTKEVYNPKDRRTYIIDVNTGKSIAMSAQGPKFRPRLTKGGR